MNEFVFDREFSPWDMALGRLKAGDTLSAGRFIALMEQDQTVNFRSIWEMIKLIESAVDTVSTAEDEEEEASWDVT